MSGAIFVDGSSTTSTVLAQSSANAQSIEIAVALPLTGDGISFGQPSLEGIQLAIEEANAIGSGPQIKLTTYDDKSSDDVAKTVAGQIVASPAAMVLGPSFSTASLAAGPVYAEANLASLPPTATSDAITENKTTFRVVFKNSDQGELLATYLVRVLGQRKAAVFVIDTGYGRTLREGFERTAKQLKLKADYYFFTTDAEAEQIAQRVAKDPAPPPIVLLTLDPEGARLLVTLRRLGMSGPFLGGDAFGDESFNQRLANEPEEQAQPGYFTDNLYGLAPVILDSANADTLAFAERFRTRFGHDPVWMAVAGYDAANLAVATVRTVLAKPGANADLPALRAAILNAMLALNSPTKAQPGLLGPFWFDEARARQQAIRVGQFYGGRFESAPVQIVAVSTPDVDDLALGTVFELGPGRYARLQQVVYTGVFLNEIPRLDVSSSSFNADFYLWLRFASDAGPGSADPADLIFPNMVGSSFDRAKPMKQRTTIDGTEYRLWRVQGEFRNDFDLRMFPFDRQALSLSFFNSRAAVDQIVYVIDRRLTVDRPGAAPTVASPNRPSVAQAAAAIPAENSLSIASPLAFRNLSQWQPRGASSRRENLVTDSALGDPTSTGVENRLELSGFLVKVEMQRRTLATLTKTLLPLLIMTMIMFASLYFPAALVKEKVTVAITAALSGAVLLTSINSQLGAVGYTITIEYAFYVFFFLSLLCITAVLSVERMRAAGSITIAARTEQSTRVVFLVTVFVTFASAWALLRS